jgi:hypothetical protein
MPLLPIPCASYQCSSAVLILPLYTLTFAIAFSFLHLPSPYLLRSHGSTRIALPIAMVSTLYSGPISSNSM